MTLPDRDVLGGLREPHGLRPDVDALGALIAGVPTESAEAAVRYVVLGSVLVEPLLLALRRVAQQAASAERFGREGE